MMKKYSLLFIALWLLLSSCRKQDGGPITVEGQVIDRLSGAPVAGASVQLMVQTGSGLSGGYSATGDPQPADAQGRFMFQFDPAPNEGYILMATTELGYRTLYAEAPRLQAGKNKGLRLPVQPPAWVKIKLVDEPPTSKIRLTVTGYEGGEFGNGVDHFTFPQSQTYVRPAFAGTNHRLWWEIRDQMGAVRTDFREYVVAPMDTLILEIKF